MATVSTTTANPPVSYPSTSPIDRDRNTGYLYVFVKGTTSNVYEVYRSTNGGTSWALFTSFTRASIVEWSGINIDYYGWLHLVFRTNESSQDRVYYRRLELDSGTWTSELLVASASNGGVAGAVYTGMDIKAAVQPTQWFIPIAVATTSGSQIGVTLFGVTAVGEGSPYVNNANFSGTRSWFYTGSGRMTPSIDLEHTGDDKTNPAPNLWITFGRASLRMVRLTFNGYGWVGPTNQQTIEATLASSHDSIAGRWDGKEFLMAVQDPSNTSRVAVYERNRANSTTTKRSTSTSHPQGVIRALAVNYNSVSRDIRVYAVGTSSAVLYYIDWSRATGLWGAWATVTATAIQGTTPNQFGVRRGSSGNARHDVLTAHATPTQVHTAQTLTYAPAVPTWDLSGKAYVDGGAANVSASLLLDWSFTSPDPADVQTAYALRRQIGAGAFSYWNAGSSTWGASEVKNVSGTTQVTLASGWGSGTDANHTYSVKVWNVNDVASSYSAVLTLIPSTQVNPSFTAPASGGTITTSQVTVTWTATEQTARRLQLATNPGGVVQYDSGWETTTDKTMTVPLDLADGSGWTITLETRNNEGLVSAAQTRNFTVDYVEPMTPTLASTPVPASGWIAVVITNPTPSGGAPALAYQDLYRRKAGDTSAGKRVAATLSSGATHNDWQAPSGAYQYLVRAYGVNGTTKDSAWTT